MKLPTIWCSRFDNPRPCSKILGIIEIVVSIIGLLLLFCLHLILLDVEREAKYIQENHHGISNRTVDRSSGAQNEVHVLNATFTCQCDCNKVINSIQEHLDTALQGQNVKYSVEEQRAEKVDKTRSVLEMLCEIIISSDVDPYKNKKGIDGTIADIVEDAISKEIGEETFNLPFKQVITESDTDKETISEVVVYPAHIKNDPEKIKCIFEHMRTIEVYQVRDDYDTVVNLMTISAAFSIIAGAMLVFASYKATRTILCILFFLEWINIGILIGALVNLNKSSLCLLEHGGLSEAGHLAPKSGQTSPTILCTLYIVFFKSYSICFVVVFANRVFLEKADRKFKRRSSQKSEKRESIVVSVAKKKNRPSNKVAPLESNSSASLAVADSATSFSKFIDANTSESMTSLMSDRSET